MSKNLQKAVEQGVKLSPNKKTKSTSRVIMGVALLIVVASIAYSTIVILMGTEGYLPWIMVAPQAVFAVIVLLKQFIK